MVNNADNHVLQRIPFVIGADRTCGVRSGGGHGLPDAAVNISGSPWNMPRRMSANRRRCHRATLAPCCCSATARPQSIHEADSRIARGLPTRHLVVPVSYTHLTLPTNREV